MDNGSCCLLQEDPIAQVMPPLLILFFVLGALGNGMALCGFCFYTKSWRPSTIYLFNLAVADFLLMVCLPFRTDYYRRGRRWAFGDAPCRLVLFMLAMNRAGSIAFLTLVAADRYLKVVHPHHAANAASARTAAGVAGALWAAAVLGTLHLLAEGHLCARGPSVSCESFVMESANGWHDVLFQLEFFLPLGAILFCSGRTVWSLRRRRRRLAGRARVRKAARLVAVVAAVFVSCHLPSVSARLYFLCAMPASACDPAVHVALHVTLSLTYMNSTLDPLVYYFSSPSFPKFCPRLKGRLLGRFPGRPGTPRREEVPLSSLCRKSCPGGGQQRAEPTCLS